MMDPREHEGELRSIREALLEQLFCLERIGDTRSAASLSLTIERLNSLLGEEPGAEEIERLRRNFFMS